MSTRSKVKTAVRSVRPKAPSRTVTGIRAKLTAARSNFATARKTRRLANPTAKAAPTLSVSQRAAAAKRKVEVDAAQKSRLQARKAPRRITF